MTGTVRKNFIGGDFFDAGSGENFFHPGDITLFGQLLHHHRSDVLVSTLITRIRAFPSEVSWLVAKETVWVIVSLLTDTINVHRDTRGELRGRSGSGGLVPRLQRGID